MKLSKTARAPSSRTSDLALRQQVFLAATGEDARRGFWALELLERRHAVARWRGQRKCSVREVLKVINGLPA
jgi:hypothetical protein